ncbi:unnamed protein product, partial [Symbiodinium natans]
MEDKAEAEMAAALQAQIRTLEQAELSQMRQGVVLQRRLDEAQRQLQELTQGAKAQRRAEVQNLQAEEAKAAASLEHELQLQLEVMLHREKEAEAVQRTEAARTQRLEEEVHYWKSCGLILRRKQCGVDAPAPEVSQEVVMEMEALRTQAKELRSQIKEIERLAASGRAQEVDLIAKNQSLAHSIALAQSAAKGSREKAACLQSELQHEQAKSLLDPPISGVRHEEVEEGLGIEEVEYWRRKVEEKKAELERITADQHRLRGGLRDSSPSLDVGEALSTRHCGFLDETISWFAT